MIKLPPLDKPLLRLEKRSNESIKYLFDLNDTLEKLEVISSSSYGRPRKGKLLEVTLYEEVVTGVATYFDKTVVIQYETNLGNKRSISFIIRNYR
jgi:hypothetical protein